MRVIQPKPDPGQDAPAVYPSAGGDKDERAAVLRAVLESRTFAKSTKLAQFLKFICTQTIQGNAGEINEQQIGIHVFSRSPMYSASDDSIVRTQARLLRQRLEEYFEHEAPSSPLIITIPKGGYVPVFERRVAAAVQTVPAAVPVAEAPVSPPEAHPKHLVSLNVVAVVVAALLLVGVLVHQWLVKDRTSSAADALWTEIFQNGRPVAIVHSDDALVLYEEQARKAVPLDAYLTGQYMDEPAANTAGISFTRDWFMNHQYTSAEDVKLTMRLGRLREAVNATVKVRNPRSLRIDDLKGHNVILIGGMGANPWVGLFTNRLNFEVNYDWNASTGYVLNKHPRQGEQAIYRDSDQGNSRRNYGVMAFLPGIEGEGNALLFEGTGMAGTESASDFLFNPTSFASFAHRIGATDSHMPYFEVLLETTSVAGNAPEVNVVAIHPIQP